VCAWDGNKPNRLAAAFYLTFADDGTPRAAFHVAPSTIRWQGSPADLLSWLLAVNGADAYVSLRLVRLAGSVADLVLSGRAF